MKKKREGEEGGRSAGGGGGGGGGELWEFTGTRCNGNGRAMKTIWRRCPQFGIRIESSI